jgi:hypothetical protein
MEGLNLIYAAQDRDRWQAVMNAVMNPRAPWKVSNFLTR